MTTTTRCSAHPAFDADYCPSCGTARVIGGTVDEISDEILDAVGDVLDADPAEWWTPSRIGRKAKVGTYAAQQALLWLEDHRMARGAGNGCWRKWRKFDALRDV